VRLWAISNVIKMAGVEAVTETQTYVTPAQPLPVSERGGKEVCVAECIFIFQTYGIFHSTIMRSHGKVSLLEFKFLY
jgi:hypothetical protein